jgi:hypothetical protein
MTANGPIPFTPEEEAEWDAEVAAWEAAAPIRKAAEVRTERNRLLAETDWTQSKDIPEEVSSLWVDYRQALRDITQSPDFPENVQWPTKPE